MLVTKPYTRDDIVPRGTEIYERDIKSLVEPEHIGKYLVIDIETGEWDMDIDPYAASLRAAKKKPVRTAACLTDRAFSDWLVSWRKA